MLYLRSKRRELHGPPTRNQNTREIVNILFLKNQLLFTELCHGENRLCAPLPRIVYI